MNDSREERVTRAVEAVAIAIGHAAVAYIGATYNTFRANDLIDALEQKLEWKLRRIER
jgi:hypothetical protein